MSDHMKFCNVCGNLYSVEAATMMYGKKDYFNIGICSPQCDDKVVAPPFDRGLKMTQMTCTRDGGIRRTP